jgi:hypothetical protein
MSERTMGASLMHTFNKVAKVATIAAGFVIGGYLGSMIFDPFFFPIIHDPSNVMGQALKSFMTDNFGFIHEWMGLSGSGGLLNTDLAQSVLAPYIENATPAVVSGGISGEDILKL